MVRPSINSEKKIVQITLSSIAENGQLALVIAEAQQDGNTALADVVDVGTIIKAIYCEMWFQGAGTQPSTTTAMVVKSPNGVGTPTVGEFTNLNTWSNKNNILEMHQGIVGDSNTNPVPFYRGWIKVPKGKQRMSVGDKFHFAVKGITEGTEICGLFIYKAYT